MPLRDYLFRVHGDCIRAGYAYPLLSALKLNDDALAQDDRVYFGPIEGVRHLGRGYLAIRDGTYFRVRAPSELTERLSNLCGRKLLLGDHVIRLGELHVEAISPASEIYAEFVAIKSMHFRNGDRHPTHREFLGWATDKLRRKFELEDGRVEIGRRRVLHIGKYPASTGYAVGVYGIDPRIGKELQSLGLGGRQHMGGSMFLPGMLPPWVRDDRKLFRIADRKIGPSKRRPEVYSSGELHHPGSGIHYTFRAAAFLRVVRRGAYPSATWVAERFGVSVPTARRFVRSVRDDLGAPLVYSDADRGWELSDPSWRYSL